MKRKLLFAALCVVGALGMRAQTDVTSTYITNPSFELGKNGTAAASATSAWDAPYGWTTENMPTSGTNNFGSYQNNGNTPSNFGKNVAPADGTYYYLGRKSWGGSLDVIFSQAPTLPVGTYALDVAYKIATQESGSNGILQLKASQSGTDLASKDSPIGATKGDNTNYFNNCGWTRIAVPFTVTEEGEVKLSIVMKFNPGSKNPKQEAFLLDDVRLYNLSEASATDAANVTGFLVNHSFELDTYKGTRDDNSTGDSGNLNYPTGWTFMLKTSGWNNCVNVTDAPSHGMYARETWAATINELQVYQSLTGLPKGIYEITADARTNDAGADNICSYGKVGDETTYSAAWDQSKMNATWNGADNWQTLSSIFAVGDEGTAEVGLHSTHFMQFDNFTFKYYGDVTIAEVKLAAYVSDYTTALATAQAFTEASMYADDWTSLQAAISSNTLNLNNPSLTENDLITATDNLNAANTAAQAAVVGKTNYESATDLINGGTNIDLTSLIVNPSFETGNADGWNSDGTIGVQAQGNKAFDNTQGNIYAEKYHTAGTIDLNQIIKYLPTGIYQASAYVYSSTGDATFYVNEKSLDVTSSKKYFEVVEVADKGSIKIGVTCNSKDNTWVCMDGFELKYLADSYANLPYTLATGKMGTDKATAQTEAETAFTSDPNMTTYNALLAAISEAESSVANYATLKTAIDKAEAVKTANNFVTAAATTEFEAEISTATSAWTDVTYTDAQATAEIAVLGSAVSGWHAIGSEGKAGAFMTSAWGKTNENWWGAPYINTWSVEGDNDGSGFSVPFFEYFTDSNKNLDANTFTATLTGLEKGAYEVEVWARVQRRSDADFNADNSMITMNVNGGDAVSIMSNTSNNVGTGTGVMRLGRYKAYGQVTDDGTLTLSIDVKLGANVHWLSWRDVKYKKVASADMTVKNEKWGTFIAPFEVTITNENITAYTVSGVDDKDCMVKTEVGTTIPANTPVVLKNETGGDYTHIFYGESVATEDSYTEGILTGHNKSGYNIPLGSYVLQTLNETQAFYQVTDATKFEGKGVANRCYLTLSAGAKQRAIFFDEEGTTNIEAPEVANAEDGVLYNLAGQQVNASYQGIVIKNGKKVLK